MTTPCLTPAVNEPNNPYASPQTSEQSQRPAIDGEPPGLVPGYLLVLGILVVGTMAGALFFVVAWLLQFV
jgi:hypothetical protein